MDEEWPKNGFLYSKRLVREIANSNKKLKGISSRSVNQAGWKKAFSEFEKRRSKSGKIRALSSLE